MSNQSFDSPDKISIRKKWGKPLLKFLSEHTQLKLSYMGLPSPYARDIEEWLEYINEVVAFQCRKYPDASSEDQDRKEIIALESKLRGYKRQDKLVNFNVYDGYLEEVLLKGRDNQDKQFQQSNTIKVYNLDFCNDITSPIEFINDKGRPKNGYKFEAVKKIFEHQEKSEGIKKFVLFLTITERYKGEDLNSFITNPDTNSHKEIIDRVNKLPKTEKKKYILRLFVISELERNLRHCGFTPHFLPTIAYSGLTNQNLLHFTLFACEGARPHQPDWHQALDKLCSQEEVFLKVDNKCQHYNNPTNLFSGSKTYAKAWR